MDELEIAARRIVGALLERHRRAGGGLPKAALWQAFGYEYPVAALDAAIDAARSRGWIELRNDDSFIVLTDAGEALGV